MPREIFEGLTTLIELKFTEVKNLKMENEGKFDGCRET